MKKIIIGGQLEQAKLKNIIEKIANDKFEVSVASDMDAAMKVQSGEADYYIGSCNTGGGGALAMAIAMLGADKCVSISTPTIRMEVEEIEKEINNGKVAFGLIVDSIEEMLPILISKL